MIVESEEAAAAAEPGCPMRIDTEADVVEVDGRRFEARPVDPFVLELGRSGGLVHWVRERIGA